MKKAMIAVLLGLMAFAGKVSVFGDTASVNYEKYVPHMLVQGKWGDGPGKFKYRMWEGEADWPRSFVVDSEKNILILDQYNNRIQEFDKNGKYVSSIQIQSFKQATDEEVEESKKYWNTSGNTFPTVSVQSIEVVGGSIYAFQHVKGARQSMDKILKFDGKKSFEFVPYSENINQSMSWKNKKVMILNQLRPKKMFEKRMVKYNKGTVSNEELVYDNHRISDSYLDDSGDSYVIGDDGIIRKYNKKEELVLTINLISKGIRNPYVIDSNGAIYILGLFATKKMESYGIEDYNGIQLTKWSKE